MATAPQNPAHPYLIRVSSPQGEVFEDRDFAEDARSIWFDQTVMLAIPGETIELLDESTGRLIESTTKH